MDPGERALEQIRVDEKQHHLILQNLVHWLENEKSFDAWLKKASKKELAEVIKAFVAIDGLTMCGAVEEALQEHLDRMAVANWIRANYPEAFYPWLEEVIQNLDNQGD